MGKPVLSNNFLQILDSSNDAVNIQVKNNHSLTKISGTHDENFILLDTPGRGSPEKNSTIDFFRDGPGCLIEIFVNKKVGNRKS